VNPESVRRSALAIALLGALVLAGCGSSSKSTASTDTTAPASTNSSLPKGCDIPASKDVAPKPTNLSAPAMTIDPNKTYTATMTTSCGEITIALDAKNSPKGVNNFVSLAKQGFYDGLKFHRIITGFVIQGGDPVGDGTGGPGYDVVTELPKDGYPLGTLAYAKTGQAPPGSAGSQFFIVTSDHPPSLDTKQGGTYLYGAFGHVTKGQDVMQKLDALGGTDEAGTPQAPLFINKVTITES
jgi:cyclophilin family peptidyl-prolyl cis-trans isomerase